MKKSLYDIFDDLDAKDLDRILNDSFNCGIYDRENAEKIKNAVLLKSKEKTKKHYRAKRLILIAACISLLVITAIVGYAYATEVREYNEAVGFFEDNGLCVEGLTRKEIKTVYRDITTNSFEYSKTADVIEYSISLNSIAGTEIFQDEPSPEEIEGLWNYRNNIAYGHMLPEREGYSYTFNSEYLNDEELGYFVHDKSYIKKYDGYELLWSVSFTEFVIWGYEEVSNGVIVYGTTPTQSSFEIEHAWMAMVDKEGVLAWQIEFDNEFSDESIEAVVENPDGTFAVFSRGNLDTFCLSQIDGNGNCLSISKTEIGNYGIWNAASLGEGYVVQLGSYSVDDGTSKIVKVDRSGSITDSYTYSSKDYEYCITDMIEFEGNVYLSAYSYPKTETGEREISSVIEKLVDGGDYISEDIDSEIITPLVRENYTAVLFICDPNGGIPREYYSIKGSLGAVLEIDENLELNWRVESITSTYFSPATSAFTIGGSSMVYEYTFDVNGILTEQKNTGEIVRFAR